MAYTYTLTDKRDYLLCVMDGEIKDVAVLISFAEKLISKKQEFGHSRLLFDDRALTVDLSVYDATVFGTYLENVNLAKMGFRIAVVYSPRNKEISRAFETSITNRSIAYQTFNDPKDAEEWLTTHSLQPDEPFFQPRPPRTS